ncbi:MULTISPECIES: hypothetical protein [unclassified Pseudomonas]|uniref:hypothetical protein n=1 Tax=unclassified Pseudomonas TaxID=196821 RepID=UPI00235DC994|nr:MULTISPECIES: hypothetical protein [unclassified Pseudomonas]
MNESRDANGMPDNWEVALIVAVEKELLQLRWLIKSEYQKTNGVEKSDVHAQVSRLTALTDLAYPGIGGLPMSETTAAKLHEHSATAMQWIRNGGSTL